MHKDVEYYLGTMTKKNTQNRKHYLINKHVIVKFEYYFNEILNLEIIWLLYKLNL